MSFLDFFRPLKPKSRIVYTPGQAGCIDPDLDRLVRWEPFTKHDYTVVVGEWTNPDDANDKRPVFCDLATAPHILVAGATGSGKSVCINAMVCSLLLKCAPSKLMLYMIDPKRVELARYRGIPHLGARIATDLDSAEEVLCRVHAELKDRFRRMERAGALHVDELGMGHILLVMDEFASLMSREGKRRLLPHLQEIARLGRAAGVHMILATQRPTRDVLDGQLKSNCPTRIAFRVPSLTDSRIILDARGAEYLSGAGDGLMLTARGDLLHFQGCYCSDRQVQYLCDYWRAQ